MKKSRDRAQPRWTVMFIGDHGKVITLKRFRLMVIGVVMLFLMALAAAGALLVFNQKLAYSNRNLRRNLETTQERIKTLRHEADLLMARLAVAEEQADDAAGRAASPEEPPETAESVPAETSPPPPSAPEETPESPAAKPEPEQPKAAPQKAAETQPQEAPAARAGKKVVMVEVEKMKVTHRAGNGLLRCEFKLLNVSPAPQRITGHVIVVLKGDDLQPGEWLALPAVKLVDGQPDAKAKGYRFAVRNWRTMRMQATVAGAVERYNLAEVYVFSEEGELWLQEVQPIEVES